MGLELKIAGKQLYVPLGWVLSTAIGLFVVVGGVLGPFVKTGLVMWAAGELDPIIKEKVVAQVEVAVDSLNVRQEAIIIEQKAQKARTDTLKLWIKEIKENAEADSSEKMTKEDFKTLMLEAIRESNEP